MSYGNTASNLIDKVFPYGQSTEQVSLGESEITARGIHKPEGFGSDGALVLVWSLQAIYKLLRPGRQDALHAKFGKFLRCCGSNSYK